MKSLRRLLIVSSVVLLLAFPGRIHAQTPPTLTPASEFSSSGDLIDGWYWLRDSAFEQSASWIFTGFSPGTADFTLNVEALATNDVNGGPGVDADFFLSYGIPPMNGHDGLLLGQQHIVLPNVHDAADPTGYTCRGQITIPRAGLENSAGLWLIVSRQDALGDLSPSTTHVAFRDASLMLMSGAQDNTLDQTTALLLDLFDSSGDFINGWYWLRDPGYGNTAKWAFTGLPSGSGNLTLDFNALATDQVNGGPGVNAEFYLTYGAYEDSAVLGRQRVSLLNAGDPADATGYLNRGSISIPRAGLENSAGLWVVVSRMDELGEYPPVDNHVAFNDQSLSVLASGSQTIGTPLTETDTMEQAAPVLAGVYQGDLGGLRADNQRDLDDWYTIKLVAGQQIALTLNQMASLNLNLSLYAPGSTDSDEDGDQLLTFVAGIDGIFTLRIHRSAGEGLYQLTVAVSEQNDAGSGMDAGNTMAFAHVMTPGHIDGLLKSADNEDWYAIDAERGQVLSLKLQMPEDATYRLRLYAPLTPPASVGTVGSEGQTRLLAYATGVPGRWLIRITRLMGEGPYTLDVDLHNQNDGGAGVDAGDSRDAALPLNAGQTGGLLMRGDDEDWYSLNLTQGQQLTLVLTSPEGSSFGMRLYGPGAQSSSGRVVSAGPNKTLSALIGQSGLWTLRINRSQGAGEYQLGIMVGSG